MIYSTRHNFAAKAATLLDPADDAVVVYRAVRLAERQVFTTENGPGAEGLDLEKELGEATGGQFLQSTGEGLRWVDAPIANDEELVDDYCVDACDEDISEDCTTAMRNALHDAVTVYHRFSMSLEKMSYLYGVVVARNVAYDFHVAEMAQDEFIVLVKWTEEGSFESIEVKFCQKVQHDA